MLILTVKYLTASKDHKFITTEVTCGRQEVQAKDIWASYFRQHYVFETAFGVTFGQSRRPDTYWRLSYPDDKLAGFQKTYQTDKLARADAGTSI